MRAQQPALLLLLLLLLLCARSGAPAGRGFAAETERLTRPVASAASAWPVWAAARPLGRDEDGDHAAGLSGLDRPALRSAGDAAPGLWRQIPRLLSRLRASADAVEVKTSPRPRISPASAAAVESRRLRDVWADAVNADPGPAGTYRVFAGALPRAVTRGLPWDALQPSGLVRASAGTAAPDSAEAAAPPTGRQGALQARIASPGAVTPLHYDSGANVVLQVTGYKTWILLPPSWLPRLQLYPKLHIRHRQSQLPLTDIELATIAEVEEGSAEVCQANASASWRPLRVDMRPGDLLYIPPFWAHEVLAAGEPVEEGDSGRSFSLNLFTAAEGSDEMDEAYGVSLPLKPKKWGPTLTARAAVIYLDEMVRALQQSADGLRGISERLLASRYRPLRTRYAQYGSGSESLLAVPPAAAGPAGGGPGSGSGSAAVAVRDREVAEYLARSTGPAVGGAAAWEYAARVIARHLGAASLLVKGGDGSDGSDGSEGKQRREEEAPEAEDLCGAEQEHAAWEAAVRPELASRGELAAAAFRKGGWPTAAGSIVRLENFVEDILARIVSDEAVEGYLELCVAGI